MEPHASTVIVQPDGSLLVHDKTQGTQNSQAYLQKVFGLPADKVRVCAAYVGAPSAPACVRNTSWPWR